MTELHKVMKKYLETNNCYPCNTFWEKQIREAIKIDELKAKSDVEAGVMLQTAEIKKEFEDKFLDGNRLDSLSTDDFEENDIKDIRELWSWFERKLSSLSA